MVKVLGFILTRQKPRFWEFVYTNPYLALLLNPMFFIFNFNTFYSIYVIIKKNITRME